MGSAQASISEEHPEAVVELSILAVVTIQNLSRINISGKTVTLPSLTEIFIVVSVLLFGFLLSVLVDNSLIFWHHLANTFTSFFVPFLLSTWFLNIQISELFNRLKSRNGESFESQEKVYLRRMEEVFAHSECSSFCITFAIGSKWNSAWENFLDLGFESNPELFFFFFGCKLEVAAL